MKSAILTGLNEMNINNLLFAGMSAADMIAAWGREATAALTLRNRGDMELDMFKVVGQREVVLMIDLNKELIEYAPVCICIHTTFHRLH